MTTISKLANMYNNNNWILSGLVVFPALKAIEIQVQNFSDTYSMGSGGSHESVLRSGLSTPCAKGFTYFARCASEFYYYFRNFFSALVKSKMLAAAWRCTEVYFFKAIHSTLVTPTHSRHSLWYLFPRLQKQANPSGRRFHA